MKTIVVACGSGIATSTIVSQKVMSLCEENDIDIDIIQCSIIEIENYDSIADLIVCSGQLERKYSVPVVVATGLITGIGESAVNEKILSVLKGKN